MATEVELLKAEIAVNVGEIARYGAENAELRRQVAVLTQRAKELQAALDRQTSRLEEADNALEAAPSEEELEEATKRADSAEALVVELFDFLHEVEVGFYVGSLYTIEKARLRHWANNELGVAIFDDRI